MASTREMRQHIHSIKNISQVTKALETVSASKVRKATQMYTAALPYAEKAWEVLVHLAQSTKGEKLHPLLADRPIIHNVLILMITSDRGLAGAYNINIVRNTLLFFKDFPQEISYITFGRKGRDLIRRRGKKIAAEFPNRTSPPTYMDVSPIGHMAVKGFLSGEFDEIYLSFSKFINMLHHKPVIHKLLPLKIDEMNENAPGISGEEQPKEPKTYPSNWDFIYEPDPGELLGEIVPRFISEQIYQAVLSAQASEHASRMIAMQHATDNAKELITIFQLEYNKVRQQAITNELLDIVGGVEAMSKIRENSF